MIFVLIGLLIVISVFLVSYIKYPEKYGRDDLVPVAQISLGVILITTTLVAVSFLF